MATKQENGGVVGRLAGKGEEALGRLMEELGHNPRLTDALGRAMSAKGKLDDASRTALGTIGLAAADEIRDLRAQLERLEQRLAKLEREGGSIPSAKRSEKKTTPSAKRETKPASASAKKKADEAASPAPGRALGGGAARGGGASTGGSS